MTYEEILHQAINHGFISSSYNGGHNLQLKKTEKFVVSMWIPSDSSFVDFRDGQAISWEFDLKDSKSGVSLHNYWQDCYGPSIKQVVNDVKTDYAMIVDLLSTHELRLVDKPMLKLWKLEIGKTKSLEYRSESEWLPIEDGLAG